MEIVEAQGVREVLFDPETGRPVRPTNDTAGPTLHSTPSAPAGPTPTSDSATSAPAAAAPAAAPAPAVTEKMLDEFPVEFNQPH
jgi:hypothetical protein